ncbi:MAG: hypothetical protein IJL02_07465 [Methanobrevibacter sp.]|uniref:hypothetical protein n=1 Tax=Methanobrevibacter sp. TaxID=66852 RepID=UPI0025F90E6E|nr:hypothetical protein [Methanobrevibacter sp.]MBQ6099684.1 hypothetical protein [Methanobrevibacter sp.]
MKKIILSLLCLLIISLGVACVAASDNTTVTHDSIQTIDQQHIPVDTNMTAENNINNKIANTTDNDVAQTVNNDTINVIDNAVTADNAVKVADNTANAQPTKNPTKLDIKGPKITKDGLKVKNTATSTKTNNRGLGVLLLFSGTAITAGIGIYMIINPYAFQ